MEGHLSVAEAAKRLGVSTSRINDLVNEGRLPYVQGSGRGRPRFIPESAVAEFRKYRSGRENAPDIVATWQGLRIEMQIKVRRTADWSQTTATAQQAERAIINALRDGGFATVYGIPEPPANE